MKRSRRWMLTALGLAGVATIGATASAGSYLDRAALLIDEAARASEYLRKHLYDVESARVVHKLSEVRLEVARQMLVPEEVIPAHPHLLLVLEQHERAAHAAVQRVAKDFLRYSSRARDEEELFRRVLKSLGWELPRVG